MLTVNVLCEDALYGDALDVSRIMFDLDRVWLIRNNVYYMVDVEQLCRRVLLINRGELVFDGALSKLTARASASKILKVSLAEATVSPNWRDYGEVVSEDSDGVSLSVSREHLPALTAQLLAELPVADITIAEPPLENVIDRIYREGV